MDYSALLRQKKVREFIRFCLVGTVAAGIHYGIYYWLQAYLSLNIAYTAGYLISLACNFFMTSYFTFRSKPTVLKATGFGFSHLINYLLHMVLFNVFLWMGVPRLLAPLLVLAVAVPANFILLRWVFKHKKSSENEE